MVKIEIGDILICNWTINTDSSNHARINEGEEVAVIECYGENYKRNGFDVRVISLQTGNESVGNVRHDKYETPHFRRTGKKASKAVEILYKKGK
jgi:hypothetical protein